MTISYTEFKEQASRLCGIDLSHYKSQQMDRRINSLMSLWKISDYEEYLEILKTDPLRFRQFIKKLTINVSEFFRNPERFQELWEEILPKLLQERAKLKIWSAGSSNGAEPYSVAIVLRELGAAHRADILGTDIDEEVLSKARQGVYSLNEVKSLPEKLLRKYFREEAGFFHLATEIKEAVTLRKHNLLLDKFETGFDLIICRNVVIYFKEKAKNKLYLGFHRSLRTGGYLWVGGTEPLLNYKEFGFASAATSFYKKDGEPHQRWFMGGETHD